jgi:hypothetical protein
MVLLRLYLIALAASLALLIAVITWQNVSLLVRRRIRSLKPFDRRVARPATPPAGVADRRRQLAA